MAMLSCSFFAVQWSALTFSVSSLRSASYSADRKRYQTNDYNLDAIIAVGYPFRKCAAFSFAGSFPNPGVSSHSISRPASGFCCTLPFTIYDAGFSIYAVYCYYSLDRIYYSIVGLGRKDGCKYGIYILRGSSSKMGHFRKAGTETLRGRAHTRRSKVQPGLADTQRRGEAD